MNRIIEEIIISLKIQALLLIVFSPYILKAFDVI
jgi:hypothetical protein